MSALFEGFRKRREERKLMSMTPQEFQSYERGRKYSARLAIARERIMAKSGELQSKREEARLRFATAHGKRLKLEQKTYARATPKRSQISGMFGSPMNLGLTTPYPQKKKKNDSLFDF